MFECHINVVAGRCRVASRCFWSRRTALLAMCTGVSVFSDREECCTCLRLSAAPGNRDTAMLKSRHTHTHTRWCFCFSLVRISDATIFFFRVFWRINCDLWIAPATGTTSTVDHIIDAEEDSFNLREHFTCQLYKI